MLEKSKVRETLDRFAESVNTVARANLASRNKNASKRLSRSLDHKLDVFRQSFTLEFIAEDYADFVDRGVDGVDEKHGSPFSYRRRSPGSLKGMPPPSAFDKWNVFKGRAGRDEKGRFLSRKQLNFLTARNVFLYGIKPSNFFSDAFEQEFDKIDDMLAEAYAIDTETLIELTFRQVQARQNL